MYFNILQLTSRAANPNMPPPSVHFADLEPAISAGVIHLNTFKRVPRGTTPTHTKQYTCKKPVFKNLINNVIDSKKKSA